MSRLFIQGYYIIHVLIRMGGDQSEEWFCETKSLNMQTLRMTGDAKVCRNVKGARGGTSLGTLLMNLVGLSTYLIV